MAVQLRHGFKAEANRWARDLRLEQRLSPESPMCPWQLCDHLGLSLTPLSDFEATVPQAVAYLRSTQGQKDFSGVTLQWGIERFIVEFFRAKDDRFFGGFTLAQLTSVALVAGGIALFLRLRGAGEALPGEYLSLTPAPAVKK